MLVVLSDIHLRVYQLNIEKKIRKISKSVLFFSYFRAFMLYSHIPMNTLHVAAFLIEHILFVN